MEIFGLTLVGYSNYCRDRLSEHYREPKKQPSLKEILEERLRREPTRSFSELYSTLGPNVGIPDGFSYGSYERLSLQRKKGVPKPVGPVEMFRSPATCAQDVGFWMRNPVLNADWVKPIKRYVKRKNENTE